MSSYESTHSGYGKLVGYCAGLFCSLLGCKMEDLLHAASQVGSEETEGSSSERASRLRVSFIYRSIWTRHRPSAGNLTRRGAS